jgi:lipopolysaccharide transport system ATP-binding protein
MNAVAQQGRTVLFVSHNMAIIQSLCRRGIVLQHGKVSADGPVGQAVGHYLRNLERAMEINLLDRTDRSGWHRIMVSALQAEGPDGAAPATGSPARFTVTTTGLQQGSSCTLTIVDHLGQPVTRLPSGNTAPEDRTVTASADQPAQFVCDIDQLPLVPGRYRVDVQLRGTHQIEDEIESALVFDVEPGLVDGRPAAVNAVGPVTLAHRWTVPTV